MSKHHNNPTVYGTIKLGKFVGHVSPNLLGLSHTLSARNICVVAERLKEGSVLEVRRFNVREHTGIIDRDHPDFELRWLSYKTDPLSEGTWRIFPADRNECPSYLGNPSLYYFRSSHNAPNKKDANFVLTLALRRWFEDHQAVKDAIQWLEPGRSWLPYDEWRDDWKCELFKAIIAQKEGYSLTSKAPLTPQFEEGQVVHDYDQARALHFSLVAETLLTEILGRAPWSLDELSRQELEILFEPYCDKSQYACIPEGYVYSSTTAADDCSRVGVMPRMLQPAPGSVVWRFLVLNEIIGDTRRDTIIRLLKWGRHHLRHFITPPDEASASSDKEFYWGHDREALAIRIMEGTYPEIQLSESGARYPYANWTKGCTTTTYLLKQVLSIVHIPVSIARPNNHHAPHFVHEGLFLAHADDIYNSAVETDYPAEELFVSEELYALWFETEGRGVDIKLQQLRVEHLGLNLLRAYCFDERFGRSHAESGVLEMLSEAYSLEELEDMMLWDRIDNKVVDLGGCSALEEAFTEGMEQFWNIERSPLLSD